MELQTNFSLNPFGRLVDAVFEEINPYQILLLVNSNIDRSIRETIFVQKFLIQDFPTTIIDVQHLNKLNNSASYPMFGSPRRSILFVLLYTSIVVNETLDFIEFNNVLDNYIKLQSLSTRPRWLTVLINIECGSNPNIELFLREAWNKKFLDFTVLEMIYEDMDVTLHYYDPFRDTYRVCAYSKEVKLFPDKLHDLNGYPLNTVFFHDPPKAYVELNSSGYTVSVNGSDYWVLITTSKVLNFTVVTEPTFAKDYSGFHNRTNVIEAVKKGNLEFTGNQIYLLNKLQLEHSMVLAPDGFCAVVPNIFVPGIGLSQHFYYGLIFIILFIACLVWISRLLRFDRDVWTWDNLFQVILGCSIVRHPPGLHERLVLASIIIVSVTYTTVYYAKMADNNLRTMDIVEFKSFRELDKSGLIPLVYRPFFNHTFENFENNKYLSNLKGRAQYWNYLNSCAEEMMRNRSFVCVLSENLGLSLIDRYRDHHGKSKIQIMRPCFWTTLKGYGYTPGSPYVEKFDEVYVRIKEAGLQVWWDNLSKPKLTRFEKDEDSENDGLRKRIYFVMSIGYSLAFAVFLIEFFVSYVNFRI